MTDKLFPDDYPEFTSIDLADSVPVCAGGLFGWSSWQTLLQQLDVARGPRLNVKDFGAVGDGVADDTVAIKACYDAAVALGIKTIYFPQGTYLWVNTVLTVSVSDMVFQGAAGAIVRFKGTGQWQCGNNDAAWIYGPFFYDLTFYADGTSTASAPLLCHSAGGLLLKRCIFDHIMAGGITLRNGTIWLQDCNGRFNNGNSGAVVDANVPAGCGIAAFIQGGTYASGQPADGQCLIRQTGAGNFDGPIILGVHTNQLAHALQSTPASGGKLSNAMALGCIFDQIDQAAFDIRPAAGATISDVQLIGNKINGNGPSTATSGGLVSIDMSSGATHANDCAIVIAQNVLVNARDRAIEIVGGTHASVIVKDNTICDYGRRVNAACRAIYVNGTFDYLEVVDNNGTTQRARDYDIEFGTVTATKRKVLANRFAGLAATKASLNQAARDLVTERPFLTADVTYYVKPAGVGGGDDTNAGLTPTTQFATRQKAWDTIAGFDLNGHAVTIQLQDGTYTDSFSAAKGPVGNGSVVFNGNSGTPANVLINPSSGNCYDFPASMSAVVTIQNQKQQASSGGGVNVTGRVSVNVANIKYGAMSGHHLVANGAGAIILETGPSEFLGNALSHASASNGGRVGCSGNTHTITGALTFSAYVFASKGGLLTISGMTFNGTGSITGKRYEVSRAGIVDTGTDLGSGPNTTYLPGSLAGTTSPGGNYW